MTNRIEQSRIQLIKNEPFFGKILCMCTIKESTQVPTAGARITKDGALEIVYNKAFMEAQTDAVMTGIWKHEVCHLLFNHTMEGRKNIKRTNVAMDLAINSYIGKNNLPKGGMFAEDFKFEKYLTTNQYYELLGGDEKEETQSEKGYEFDDHSGLDGDAEAGEVLSKEVAKAIAEQMAREAAKGLSAGNIPLEMLKSLDLDIYSDGTLSWKTLLRKYAKDTLTNTKVSTRNKPNRRVGFSADGNTDDRLPSIYIAIDESGSISEELLAEFSGEINRLFKEYSGTVKIMHFDTEISKVETVKKSITRLQRFGGGGTDPSSCFEMFDREKGDLLVMFTDGYFFSPQTCKRGKNVIFLIYNNPSFVPEFGKSIIIK
jgi:predicted metal-dependent peptidase